MVYHTVFEVGARSPFYSTEGVMFVACLLAGLGLCSIAFYYWKQNHMFAQFLSAVAFVGFISLIFSLLMLLWVLNVGARTKYLRSLLAAGEYSVVSGPVHDFHPERASAYEQKRSETFAVMDQTFYYSQYFLNGGFNQTVVMGSPIKDGLPVRVFYNDRLILKLQVGDQKRVTNQVGAN